ncbi:hypothetical protein HK100_003027 [Physocladia obscura]|uniref:Methyltransferase domain-containing protein n=1 Tax=Physocladia obscura TaxID=109957 RepID=A0AAD5SUI5_9FUNG|nr:hypothetical protein HK100_003027 [Physocladia obscura]
MGSHQSTIAKPTRSVIPPAQTHLKSSTTQGKTDLDSPSVSILQSPKSKTNSSKKYVLKAAHVNSLVAKTWNPNDPASWEPEMREYHELPNSDYMLPSDAQEQDRLELQHYIYRAAYQGDIICPAVKDLVKFPGYKLLDVGCAKGFWLKCIQKDNPKAKCYGVDISKTLVEQSSEQEEITLQFGNVLETLPCEWFL